MSNLIKTPFQPEEVSTGINLLRGKLQSLSDAIHLNAVEKGFHDDGLTHEQFVERHTGLLHEEVSELFSAVRSGNLHAPCDKADKMTALNLPPLTCAEEEYADIVIRAFDQMARLGIDAARAITIKHLYNTTREPMHGKKF